VKDQLNILVIGSGGREHALAWKLAQSPRVARVYLAPGNGGTPPWQAQLDATKAWSGSADEAPTRTVLTNLPPELCRLQPPFTGIISLAHGAVIDLTVVGPEVPLADGIVDAFTAAGLRCFGPTQAAARLESSKTFAKAFMARHHIPTGRYGAFTDYSAALDYVRAADTPLVVKASGLAAGKGVMVTSGRAEAEAALHSIMADREFGTAGDEVVIEERLYGQEASVLAFSDGVTVVPMLPAQDHKAVFDGDQGPNTGGMGAYAPAPLVTPALMDEIIARVLQPTVDGMRAEGSPYVGVLYAGLMIGPTGIQVLEFNCRFGDPETQAILPLLETDLVEAFEACLDGTLDRLALRWHPGAAVTVVAASGGYPGPYRKGLEITGIAAAEAQPGVSVFHAGTRRGDDGRVLIDGGRVLSVTGIGADVREAIGRAYAGMACVHFEGMHYRRDIGAKAMM
jgi:phosphoribosylamine--glycine ligase